MYLYINIFQRVRTITLMIPCLGPAVVLFILFQTPGLFKWRKYDTLMPTHSLTHQLWVSIGGREAQQPSSLSQTILMHYSKWSKFISHPHRIYGKLATALPEPRRNGRRTPAPPHTHTHPTMGPSKHQQHTGCLLIKIFINKSLLRARGWPWI